MPLLFNNALDVLASPVKARKRKKKKKKRHKDWKEEAYSLVI